MIVILNTILPVVLISLGGWFSSHYRLLNHHSGKILSNFVFDFAMPALLFLVTSTHDMTTFFNLSFIIAYMSAMVITLFVTILSAKLLYDYPLPELSLAGINASHPSIAYVGIPILLNLFGEKGLIPFTMSLLISTSFLIPLTLVLVELGLTTHKKKIQSIKKATLPILKNPVLIAPIAGMLYSYFFPTLPLFAEKTLDLLSAAAAPCILFAMGFTLDLNKLKANYLEICWITGVKLLVQPVLTLIIILKLEIDPLWGACAVILASLPTGKFTFAIAQKYNLYENQSAGINILSSVISVITVGFFIYLVTQIWPNLI